MRESRFKFGWRKTEIRVREGPGGPRPPSAVAEGTLHTIAKAGMFCVCESRLSHRSPIFFLQTDPGAGCVSLNAMLRVTPHVSMHHIGGHECFNYLPRPTCAMKFTYAESIVFQSFDFQSICRLVSRHGVDRNVRLK
jgi:hypothetical protein